VEARRLLTNFFNERTRRVRDDNDAGGFWLRVEKRVVLDGDAAGFSAALDSRQAAAKRADGARRATHAPQGSLFEVAASFAHGVSNASTLSVRQWASLASCSVETSLKLELRERAGASLQERLNETGDAVEMKPQQRVRPETGASKVQPLDCT
jgi:hypothetical protein